MFVKLDICRKLITGVPFWGEGAVCRRRFAYSWWGRDGTSATPKHSVSTHVTHVSTDRHQYYFYEQAVYTKFNMPGLDYTLN
jgi:hypothetical protein